MPYGDIDQGVLPDDANPLAEPKLTFHWWGSTVFTETDLTVSAQAAFSDYLYGIISQLSATCWL